MRLVQPDQLSTAEKMIRELNKEMTDNETIDSHLLNQGHRLLETKKRQQNLMDEMANRIDLLFVSWQESQSRHQLRMQSSFNLASENLPLCSKTMLSLNQLDQFKKRLELVSDKIRLLVEADKTATSIHQRVARNSAKLEQVAFKAEEMEARLKKKATELVNSANAPNEAKSVLLAELVRLEKVEGDKRQLAQSLAGQLKVFLEKTSLTATVSQTSIKSREATSTTTAIAL